MYFKAFAAVRGKSLGRKLKRLCERLMTSPKQPN